MTLFKQVALLVSLVFLLIVATTTIGNLQRFSTFVEGQLQTAAQDMTTTLGITIGNTASGDDAATYETLFNAVFDSGYYSSIKLTTPDGDLIHKKDRHLEIEGVPDWFISLVSLQPVTATTQVIRGWIPLGTLQLTLHPGHVYAGLYNNMKATLLWFALLFTSGIVILWLLLHKLLKPLQQVKQQADAIHNNQFVTQSQIPRTAELGAVVEAMNRMVTKVHMIFDDQEKTLASYQKLLYEDKLTGLGNRQYFITRLERQRSEEAYFHCNMSVIRIHNLDYIRDHFGYEKAEAAIITLAAVLKQVAGNNANELCARLADNEFALLIPSDVDPVVAHIKDIFNRFRTNTGIVEIQGEISLSAGITSVNPERSIGTTLSESDFALTQAAASGPYAVKENISTSITLPEGKMQWRSWLQRSIAEEKLFLVQQKVMNTDGSIIHQEVFVRLRNESGEVVPAGMFIPMANALNMGEEIDRAVFKLVKALNGKQDIPIALNLTASVFRNADALVEFNQLLHYFQPTSTKLCIEASHAILEQFPAMCTEVAESVRNAGHTFGIDNLNLGQPLQALMSLRPDYVKVNAKTLYDMTTGDSPAGYQALQTMVKAMDIQLIAVGVDSQQVLDHLRGLGVDVMQGNLLSEPEEIA